MRLHRADLVKTIIIVLSSHFNIIDCARIKELKAEKAATCITANTDKYIIQFPGPLNYTADGNRIHFFGNFTVTETIKEPLEVAVIANRCSVEMKTCEPFNKLTLSRVCTYINDENGIFISFFKSITPVFRCPIKPGLYTFQKSVLDLTFFTIFALEGYRWQANIKLFSRDNAKRELYCLATQALMRWVRRT
ncbi:uncharacterized protein LOC129777228 [Toxorhynchites rutilus septentrionalis]|uniref:uncharacterized protein LOC129777228 n=1 Tax=Toxorhynchites rutilus septentrionalis TaxID=329112 RepID=UPI002479C299|nr:uncharacterized protein LOC129777228 [Toxorhynchites rutilus septentrionalis]